MLFTTISLFLATFAAMANAQGVPVCTDGRDEPMCAQFIRPYSDNAYTWSTLCGINVPANTLIADQTEKYDVGFDCDFPYAATCCSSWLGCGLGIDCNGPETAPPLPARGATLQRELPDNWVIAVECAIDNPNRVLANSIVSYEQSNTPFGCASSCIAKGYQYAGVEYGDECYCGTGYVDGVVPQSANVSDCDVICPGSYHYSCGGSWRMQIFKAPTAP